MDDSDSRILPVEKGIDWHMWSKRGVNALRTGLELFLAVKTRNVALLGLSVASAVEVAADWTNKEKVTSSIDERLRAIGLYPLFSRVQLMRFIVQTCRELTLPTYDLVLSSGEGANTPDPDKCKVVVYELTPTCKIYVQYIHGLWLEAVYGTSQEDVLDALSIAVKRKFGNYITLTVAFENGNAFTGLAASEVHLEAYVPSVDVVAFCSTLKKFQERGLNRASLLIGEPGTGKTTFAAAVAQHLQGRLFTIEAQSLNKIMDSGLDISQLITIVSPRVILFDDLDRVDCLDQLFGEMERLNRARREYEILVLASVNDVGKIPDALRREGRFDEKLVFSPPEEDSRREILKGHLTANEVHLGRTQDFDNLVGWTEGMVGSALREVALQASVRPLSQMHAHIEYMKKMKNAGCADEGVNGTSKTLTPGRDCLNVLY